MPVLKLLAHIPDELEAKHSMCLSSLKIYVQGTKHKHNIQHFTAC
jgi:hypothetical protein